jgi:hypothetical protein
MRRGFVQINGEHFTVDGEPILLRGYALGTWLNLEHFMIGLPGTDTMIRDAFADVYGEKKARCFFDRFVEQFVKEEDVLFLKNMGTNSIRIPFGYHYFLNDRNPDVFQERGFQLLNKIIKFCEKHKMYAILDLHSAPGSQNNDWHSDNMTGQSLFWQYRCFQDQIVALWKELASRYNDNPWIAGYDVLNEPGYGLTKEEINSFYNRVVAGIREVDKDHIIFLEGEDFGRNFSLFDEPEDPQVTYAVHFYPFVLEENVLDPAMEEAKRQNIFEMIFYTQLKNWERFHRPIWCGESGYVFLEGQEEFYSKLILSNIKLCENNNISWSLWTYKDARKMGIIVPRENSQWIRLRRDVEQAWSHEWEQENSMKIIKDIGERYYQPLDSGLLYDLDFRIRSIMHRIAVEQILKPRLRTIPWEEMERYPDSFAWENCEPRVSIVRNVIKFIADQNGSVKNKQ